MARRFIYFQGAAVLPDYPLKMLFEGPDGFYVGGWSQEPVFVASDPGVFGNRLLLYGITATGSGPNDWLVGGWRRVGSTFSLVFYDHTGLIYESANLHTFIAVGGHFSSSYNLPGGGVADYYWARATGAAGGPQRTINFEQGFVLPGVISNKRLDDMVGFGTLRNSVIPNLDLSYAVFLGNASIDTATYPNGNPWLASAGGSFTRINTDLNTAISRSDLIGLTLYERDQDFLGAAPWPSAGEHSLTITPHSITTGGAVTTGTPFPVKYQAPDPSAWFTWDASLWVEPPAP